MTARGVKQQVDDIGEIAREVAGGPVALVRERLWRSRYQLQVGRDGGVVARVPAGWSDGQIEKMLYKHRRWLDKRGQERQAREEKQAARVRLSEAFCELPESWYRKSARIILKRACDVWAARMGLKYGKLRITGARSRWGSCSSRGDLSFSWRLLATRWDLVEYVVVHELAHRVHFNHGVRFWRLVEKHVPDYEVKRAELRAFGGDLG